jgi:uncharacterized RDD family membrane protein YckC
VDPAARLILDALADGPTLDVAIADIHLTGAALALMTLASTPLYAVTYVVALRRVPTPATSPYGKASPFRRSAAAAIDLLLVFATAALYARLGAWAVVAGAVYLMLRDGIQGRSVGKWIFGLRVVSLETGRPTRLGKSALRNVLLVVPPPILAGAVLESHTALVDPQGLRLGDRLARTQVVEGYGLADLIDDLQRVTSYADHDRFSRSAPTPVSPPAGTRPARG